MKIKLHTPEDAKTFKLVRSIGTDDIAGAKAALDVGASANGFSTRSAPLPLYFAKSAEMAELLIEHGANVDKRSEHTDGAKGFSKKWGNATLHIAPFEVAQVLLNHGADPEVRNKGGETPLHWAAKIGDADKCQLLIDNGADPNSRAISVFPGATPLHLAGNIAVARVLIHGGADPGRQTVKTPKVPEEPRTAPELLEHLGRKDIASFVRSEQQVQQLTSQATKSWSPSSADVDSLAPKTADTADPQTRVQARRL